MQQKIQKIQYNINKFNGLLLLLKGGSKSIEDIKQDVNEIYDNLKLIRISIESKVPLNHLKEVHRTVLNGAINYEKGVKTFLEIYVDGDEDHMVEGGLYINEANNMMHKAAKMIDDL